MNPNLLSKKIEVNETYPGFGWMIIDISKICQNMIYYKTQKSLYLSLLNQDIPYDDFLSFSGIRDSHPL